MPICHCWATFESILFFPAMSSLQDFSSPTRAPTCAPAGGAQSPDCGPPGSSPSQFWTSISSAHSITGLCFHSHYFHYFYIKIFPNQNARLYRRWTLYFHCYCLIVSSRSCSNFNSEIGPFFWGKGYWSSSRLLLCRPRGRGGGTTEQKAGGKTSGPSDERVLIFQDKGTRFGTGEVPESRGGHVFAL